MTAELVSRIKSYGLGMTNIVSFSDQAISDLLDKIDDINDEIGLSQDAEDIKELEGERDHILICLDDGITGDDIINGYLR